MARSLRVHRMGMALVVGWALALASLIADTRPWPHERSSLEPDEDVTWGALDNGFRYALMPHRHSPGRISMRLVVEVGSFDEEESEQGLAHFVEHMAFEGTRHFRQGELFDFFQRLGMSFGGDVTAFTHFDHTVYHLELPRNDAELVGQSLMVYRDFADGILFDAERIEKERQVILREKQARDRPSARIHLESLDNMMEGTLIPQRHPIGTLEVLERADREALLEFYSKWYRPDLMTLVVVGDIEVARLEGMIAERFASLEEPPGRLPRRKLGRPDRERRPSLNVLAVDGVERAHVGVSRAWHERRGRDSERLRERDFLRDFAMEMLNQRCRQAIDGIRDDFADYHVFHGIPAAELKISIGSDGVEAGVAWIDFMIRQALAHGFSQAEIDALGRKWRSVYRRMAGQYGSSEPRDIIDSIVDSLLNDQVYLSIEDESELALALLDEVTPRRARRAMREIWKLNQLKYMTAGDFEREWDEDWLANTLRLQRKLKVPPFLERPAIDLDLSRPGLRYGVAMEKRRIEGIDAQAYRFDNNVRMTYLKTSYDQGEMYVVVRVGGGLLEFAGENPADHELALQGLFRTGVRGYTGDEVYDYLLESLTSFSMAGGDHDAFVFRARGDEGGVRSFLQVISEYMRNPLISEEAFDISRAKAMQSRQLEPDGLDAGYRELVRMLYPEKIQFHLPTLEDYREASRERANAWLEQAFLSGFIEAVVVGDIEEERAIQLVASTLGALPVRDSEKSKHQRQQSLDIRPRSGSEEIAYKQGKGDNAVAVITWTVLDEEVSFDESAALYILSSILEDRLHKRVREELGQSYAPSVSYVTYFAYTNYRQIRAEVDCLASDALPLREVVLEIMDDLRRTGVSEDEVRRAVAPLHDRVKQAWRDNAFLADNLLYSVVDYPKHVERSIRIRDGALSEIGPSEIQGVAGKYLSRENALAVAILPRQSAATAEGATLPNAELEAVGKTR